MPHISEMSPSRFFKGSDVKDREVRVTIKSCTQENVAPKSQPPSHAWVLHFNEVDKGLKLGATNLSLVAAATGENDSENWIGKRLILWFDPDVLYKSDRIGGIRVKAPSSSPAPPLQTAPNEYKGETPTPSDDWADPESW